MGVSLGPKKDIVLVIILVSSETKMVGKPSALYTVIHTSKAKSLRLHSANLENSSIMPAMKTMGQFRASNANLAVV